MIVDTFRSTWTPFYEFMRLYMNLAYFSEDICARTYILHCNVILNECINHLYEQWCSRISWIWCISINNILWCATFQEFQFKLFKLCLRAFCLTRSNSIAFAMQATIESFIRVPNVSTSNMATDRSCAAYRIIYAEMCILRIRMNNFCFILSALFRTHRWSFWFWLEFLQVSAISLLPLPSTMHVIIK